jgi:hypothetical protein
MKDDMDTKDDVATTPQVCQSIKPWNQREGEPDKWYARFLVYLNLGVNRTVEKCRLKCLENGTEDKRGTGMVSFQKTATNYEWIARANSFDKEQQVKNLEANENTLEKFRKKTHESYMKLADKICNVMDKGEMDDLKKLLFFGKSKSFGDLAAGHRALFGDKQQVEITGKDVEFDL